MSFNEMIASLQKQIQHEVWSGREITYRSHMNTTHKITMLIICLKMGLTDE